ncbi:MAG: hypothetical protein K6E84_08430 [Lachnospiraceae bacterium]|nr:hypothetical protein [Lachnospiraceae bacterium]
MTNLSEYWFECRRSSMYFSEDEETAMFRHPLLAHALGGYKGYKYTNSREAMEYAYACGFRYMETDVAMTDDGRLVCSHGWNEENCERTGMQYDPAFAHMTQEMFLAQKVNGLTTMDVGQLYAFMKEHEDLYVEVDPRSLSPEETRRVLGALKEAFQNDRSVLDRCLIQFYTRQMLETAKECYPVKYSQMLARRVELEDVEDFIDFCVRQDITAVAVKNVVVTEELIGRFRNAGLKVLVYSVDRWRRAAALLSMGADTICTNFIEMEAEEEMVMPKDRRTIYDRGAQSDIDQNKIVIFEGDRTLTENVVRDLQNSLKAAGQKREPLLIARPGCYPEDIGQINRYSPEVYREAALARMVIDLGSADQWLAGKREERQFWIGVSHLEDTASPQGFDLEPKDMAAEDMLLTHPLYRYQNLLIIEGKNEGRLLRRAYGYQNLLCQTDLENPERVAEVLSRAVLNVMAGRKCTEGIRCGSQAALYGKIFRYRRKLIRWLKKKKIL